MDILVTKPLASLAMLLAFSFGGLHAMDEQGILGDLHFPSEWTVFAEPVGETGADTLSEEASRGRARAEAALELGPPEMADAVPSEMSVGGKTLKARAVQARNGQFDFRPFWSPSPSVIGDEPVPDYTTWGRMAHVCVSLESPEAQQATLGFGADMWMKVWLNGELVLDTTQAQAANWPPSISDHQVNVRLKEGANVLAARFVSGKGSSVLAMGGPRELRAGNFKSILTDPFLRRDSDWTAPGLRARPADKAAADIGTRRELFVDDFLIDAMTGSAERVLHRPVPRGVALELDKPWEGKASAYFSVVEDGGLVRLYYNARPRHPEGGSQTTCLAESEDGVHFARPVLGLYESIAAPGGANDPNYDASKQNNMVWRQGASGHNFSPFLDPNPAAPPDQRYKAVAYPPSGGDLAVYASPDGIHWRMLAEGIVGPPGPDSQNVAFWDALRERYVLYFRRAHPDRPGLRGIWRAESRDFIEWSDLEPIQYEDDRAEHMYTNCIRPYFRAPHIYIGTPARYVPRRKKVAEHPNSGVSDAVLMSSRDGKTFQRWAQAFIRPAPEAEVWTDRNNYPAWGMVQTSPTEISLYWTEHYRHPGMRLRRGTIRVDGFVSLASGEQVGEMLTRPLVFSGRQLEVNYATSAVGALRFELCDEDGHPYEGFSLADSDKLFGNEIETIVTWNNRSDLSHLAGKPVRLRVRLRDADLYSLRFAM